jgi:DNA-binding MarR family transcriptional regulator
MAVTTVPRGAAELTDAVNRLRRALRASIRTDIAWEALPMAQVELLQSLAERSPARVTDLAERLHLAQSTVSGLVGQLMAAGLVVRDTDVTDRRAAVVTLAEAGQEQLRQWRTAHERRIGAALDQLSESDRDAVEVAIPALSQLAVLLAAESEPDPDVTPEPDRAPIGAPQQP